MILTPDLDRLFNFVFFSFGLAVSPNGERAKYFLAFNSLLHYVDGDWSAMKSIDVMTFENEYEDFRLDANLNAWAIRKKKEITHNGRTFYAQYAADGGAAIATMPLNVYYLIKKKNSYMCVLPKEEKYTFNMIPAAHLKGFEQCEIPETNRSVSIPLWKGALLEHWYPMFYVPGRKRVFNCAHNVTAKKLESVLP